MDRFPSSQIVFKTPTVGKRITVTITATSITTGPQPFAIVITGGFKKDYRLFPLAIPNITAFATAGPQVSPGSRRRT